MKRLLVLVLGICFTASGWVSAAPQHLTASLEKDSVVIKVDGKLFSKYQFNNRFGKKPYMWPLAGPVSGESVTTESSEPYPHHNSMWFGCDKINGNDFWHHQNPKGKQVSRGPEISVKEGERVVFEDITDWIPADGEPIMRDFRMVSISAPDSKTRIVDFSIVWLALEKLRIKKTNHSLFAIRVTPDLSVKGGGVMVNAGGKTGEKGTFGKSSPWMDYYGTRNGITEGVALFQHPSNRWYPSPWFTRDYGFFSPTPMYWLKKGYVEINKGETVALSYRVIIHAGDTAAAGIDEKFASYAESHPLPVRGYMQYVLTDSLPKLAAYKWGTSRESLMKVERLVQDSASIPAMSSMIEDQLLKLLEDADTTTDAKRFICRQLSMIGGDASVKPLEKLLRGNDEHLSEMAVFALARIGSSKAEETLLSALPDVKGDAKAGLVNALGISGNIRAVAALNEIALGSDDALAYVAVSSLGRIGGDKAVSALLTIWDAATEGDQDVADALFTALDYSKVNPEIVDKVCRSVYAKAKDVGHRLPAARLLAVKGSSMQLIKDALSGSDHDLKKGAILILADLPAERTTSMVSRLMETAGNAEKVLLLGIIEKNGDCGSSASVRDAVKSDDQGVREAAFRTLAVIGGRADVALLLEHADKDKEAFKALVGLHGRGVTEDLIKMLSTPDSGLQPTLIEVMAERGDSEFAPAVFALAKDNDPAVSLAALKGLRRVGDINTLTKLIIILNDEIESLSYRSAVEMSIAKISLRLAGDSGAAGFVVSAYPNATDTGKASLLRIMGRLQDERSLSVIEKAATDSNAGVKDAAVRALARWSHESAIEPLIKVAGTTDDLRHNVLALRGAARLLKSSGKSPDKLMPLYEAGEAAAKRDEERRMFEFNGVVLKDFKAESKGRYKMHVGGLSVGSRWTTDRKYTFESLPESLVGETYVETCMGDQGVKGNEFMTFSVDEPVEVVVAYDSRCKKLPAWLADWTPGGESIKTSASTGCELKLMSRTFPAGRVVLGGNSAPGAGAMYIVIVKKG